jgi:hypothetical protein
MIIAYVLQEQWVRFIIKTKEVSFEKSILCERYQSGETFLLTLNQWMEKNPLDKNETITIATHAGPGRFTPVRTLLSIAQGLYIGFAQNHQTHLMTPKRWALMDLFLHNCSICPSSYYLTLESKKDTFFTCLVKGSVFQELEMFSTEQLTRSVNKFPHFGEWGGPKEANFSLASFDDFLSCEHRVLCEYIVHSQKKPQPVHY